MIFDKDVLPKVLFLLKQNFQLAPVRYLFGLHDGLVENVYNNTPNYYKQLDFLEEQYTYLHLEFLRIFCNGAFDTATEWPVIHVWESVAVKVINPWEIENYSGLFVSFDRPYFPANYHEACDLALYLSEEINKRRMELLVTTGEVVPVYFVNNFVGVYG